MPKKSRSIGLMLAADILLLILLPQLVFVQFRASSLSVGMVAASMFVVLIHTVAPVSIARVTVYRQQVNGFLFCSMAMAFLSVTHVAESYKPLYSGLVIIALLGVALFTARQFTALSFAALRGTLTLVLVVLSLLGWVGIAFDFRPLLYAEWPKPLFPFFTQSAYGLAVGYFSIVVGGLCGRAARITIVVNLLLQAALLPSLTLVVFSVGAMFVFFGARNLPRAFAWGGVVAVLALFAYEVGEGSDAMAYLVSRLTITPDSENLTTLVFIQGAEDAWRGLIDTFGLGYGFQMLGTNQAGAIGDRIVKLVGTEFNRADGGFLTAKLIAEFGLLGVVIVGVYFVYFMRYASFASKALVPGWRGVCRVEPNSQHRAVFQLMISAFFVEIFFRGVGYFSPQLFLVAVAVFGLRGTSQRRRTKLGSI